MLKLQFLDNRQASFWIVDENFGIGSEIKNQMVIKDDQVRPFHATIQQRTGRLFITPTDTDAQTSINGHRITEMTEILVGDVIGIGNIELKLIDPARHSPRTPAPNSTSAKSINTEIGWQIKAMTGPLSGKTVAVDSSKIIGRDPAADIIISGGHISRRHAEMLLRDGQLWVRDLNSSNGTYVNNRKVDEITLYLGDEIKFDAVIFRVVVGRSAPKDKAADDMNMEKTQFRPALNIPAATRAPEARPIPPAPLPAPMPAAPLPSAPVTPEPTPAPVTRQIDPIPAKSGVPMSPVILLVMVVVLAALAGLVLMNM
jgi:pSer/pThr/pTyr-binding forkhead associated (FHA) protein